MNHKDLDVWKKSIKLVSNIYELTKIFPKEELYCLTNQIRRCAISIPSNIAEGCARYSNKETMNFLNIAMGSIAELETQIIIANNLGYVQDCDEIYEEIITTRKLVTGLIKYLKNADN